MGFPLGSFRSHVGLRDGGGHRASENKMPDMASVNKKNKRNLSDSDTENEAADVPRLIFIVSLEEVFLAIFSPFLIEKIILAWVTQKKHKGN